MYMYMYVRAAERRCRSLLATLFSIKVLLVPPSGRRRAVLALHEHSSSTPHNLVAEALDLTFNAEAVRGRAKRS